MTAGNPFAGPVPKKDAERRRRNKSDGPSSVPSEVVNVDELLAGEVEIPKPKKTWHPVALAIYEAQMRSGQVIWMEPSDWAMLYMICESISRDMKPQPIGINEETGKAVMATVPLKGASISGYLKAFEALMMAEGGRRRLRVELERKKRLEAAAEGDNVTDIVEYRAQAFKGS